MELKQAMSAVFSTTSKQQQYDDLIVQIIQLRTADIKLTAQEKDDLERELSDQLYKNNAGRLIYALTEAKSLYNREVQKTGGVATEPASHL